MEWCCFHSWEKPTGERESLDQNWRAWGEDEEGGWVEGLHPKHPMQPDWH